jgi:hypothetical protein
MFNDTIQNAAGCDSIITIDLTVNSSTASVITDTGLDIYTAPSGATYTSSGTYADTILNAAGCDSIITIDLTMSFAGLNDLNVSDLRIFPNPVRDILTIEGLDELNEIRAVIITDLNGKMVKSAFLYDAINVSSLSSGVYIVQIEHEIAVEKIKFIKE